MATIRYLVHDVDAAVAFYVDQLDFELEQRMGPAFAAVKRDDLSLWLSGPRSSAAQSMPDGREPESGGWNRLVVEVDAIEEVVERLCNAGARFRNAVLAGVGGKQILVEDPAGNPVELSSRPDDLGACRKVDQGAWRPLFGQARSVVPTLRFFESEVEAGGAWTLTIRTTASPRFAKVCSTPGGTRTNTAGPATTSSPRPRTSAPTQDPSARAAATASGTVRRGRTKSIGTSRS
ncbi:MAG: VOC family protein [Gaiellaceae bacterium MAG52_C11]|nr:VOC family protein [Candidatus Gaiellasilicea maunaloa]